MINAYVKVCRNKCWNIQKYLIVRVNVMVGDVVHTQCYLMLEVHEGLICVDTHQGFLNFQGHNRLL